MIDDVENVLFLGDTHANTGFTKRAIDVALWKDCQTIVQLGDFGIWDHTPQGEAFLKEVETTLAEEANGMVLIFTDGNHENFESLYGRPVDDDGFRRVTPHIWHAPRGHIWEMGSKVFLAMGGAHSIDGPGGPPWWKARWGQGRGPLDEAIYYSGSSNRLLAPGSDDVYRPRGYDLGGWWPQEMITEEEVSKAISNVSAYPNEIDVMIAHDCPIGVKIPGIDGYELGDMNRERLEQVFLAAKPRYFFGGHYHRRFTAEYKGCTVEILAHDGANEEQALAISLGEL